MPTNNPKSVKALEWITNYFKENDSWPTGYTVAKATGCSARTSRNNIVRVKKQFGIIDEEGISIIRNNGKQVNVKYSENNDGKTITIDSLKIVTLDEAIQLANIDLNLWSIVNSEFTSWTTPVKLKNIKNKKTVEEVKQVTNYRTFIRIKPLKTLPINEAIDNIVKGFPVASYIKTPINHNENELLFVPSLYDVHIGKFAWGKETNGMDQDLKIIRNTFTWAVNKLFSRIEYQKVNRILAVIGHDWLHIDNQEGTTRKAENRLDFDTRLIKVIEVAYLAAIDFIKKCLEVAPVDVVWIPGNHDEITSYALCRILKEHFINNENVTVDIEPTKRKSYVWGTTLIGMTHQALEPLDKLPNILASEWPELWGKSKYREMLIGHLHKKEEKSYFPTQTAGRVIIRRVPSMSSIDAWHYEYGYVDAVRAAEGYLYSKTEGNIATVVALLDVEEKTRLLTNLS